MGQIDIDNVSFYYRDNNQAYLALENIELSIADGEFLCLVGHSGCGKSTLLSLLAGLNQPDSGEIRVDGVPVTGPSVSRAMVFQHYSLFPWMKVARNVAFSLRHSGQTLTKDQIAQKVQYYLEQVGMAGSANQYPYQLSGGMRQRVALARALAMESEILLLDEPFGALDARNRTELQKLLLDLWHGSDKRRTVVFVTHDIGEALLLADRVVFMRPRHIQMIESIDFPRPRHLDELTVNPDFRAERAKIMDLFYTGEGVSGFDDADGSRSPDETPENGLTTA